MADEFARRALAKTIYQFYKVKVDWQKYEWTQLNELYQRLNNARSIEMRWGIKVDWANKTADELHEIWLNGPATV